MTETSSIFDSNDSLEFVSDSEGNSWTEACGSAQLSLLEPMDGVTIDNNEVYIQGLAAGTYTITLVQQGDEGTTEQLTEVTFSTCGAELNDWAITVPEQSEKTIFTEDYTFENMCPDMDIYISDDSTAPDFIFLDDDYNMVVDADPYLVSNVGVWDVEVTLDNNGETSAHYTTVTVEAQCDLQEFVPLEGFPEALSMTQVTRYDPSDYLELNTDSEGASWSEHCGTAEWSVENAPDGVYIDEDGLLMFDAAPGEYTITIVRTNDLVGEQRDDFTFQISCSLSAFETYEPSELGDIYIDNESTHQVSFSFQALPEACSLSKNYEVSVDNLEELPAWMDISEATGDQPVLLITRDSEETVGSFVVTIRAFMGTIESDNYYQFRVNFYLEDCLRSQFTYSNVLGDFEWEIDQGADSYSSEEIGVQQFVVDLVDTDQCASTVTYTAWVRLTPTSAEVEYTELNAANVWKYL
jgi:hypothetical protein